MQSVPRNRADSKIKLPHCPVALWLLLAATTAMLTVAIPSRLPAQERPVSPDVAPDSSPTLSRGFARVSDPIPNPLRNAPEPSKQRPTPPKTPPPQAASPSTPPPEPEKPSPVAAKQPAESPSLFSSVYEEPVVIESGPAAVWLSDDSLLNDCPGDKQCSESRYAAGSIYGSPVSRVSYQVPVAKLSDAASELSSNPAAGEVPSELSPPTPPAEPALIAPTKPALIAPAEPAPTRPVEPLQGVADESSLDRAIRELDSPPGISEASSPPANTGLLSLPLTSTPGGQAQLKLIDVSLDGLFAAGSSTESDPSLQELEGGGHDPRKRGFTVRGVELSMMGSVDPYLDGEMHLINYLDPIEGATVTELEEAFMTTRALPHGYQIKAGQYLTEFGRNNPTHPHAWQWLDQPIICTRVFGPDGMRGPGTRVSWLVPVDWFSQVIVGVQNANGEQMSSFLANQEFFDERPIGGRPFVYLNVRDLGDLTYSARLENSWTRCDEQITWLAGASAAIGPNCTGYSGNTQILGLDLTRKWKPSKNERGWPFTIWTSEFIMRRYWATSYNGPNPHDEAAPPLSLPSETLTDWGFYTQWLYGFKPKWAVGLRYEYVWGNGDSLNNNFQFVSNNADPFRDNRHRLSPLLAWYLTEFSRFNFQYNYDYAEHLPSKSAHTFWLGAEFILGAHPAHKF